MTALLRTLAELARLRLPVTAAAALATVLAIVAPFGVELGDAQTARVTGALVALGVVIEWLRQLLAPPAPTVLEPNVSLKLSPYEVPAGGLIEPAAELTPEHVEGLRQHQPDGAAIADLATWAREHDR